MLKKKVGIVKGASRGIGYAIARELARDGYALALFARSSRDRVKVICSSAMFLSLGRG